jgi:hypothetical protein
MLYLNLQLSDSPTVSEPVQPSSDNPLTNTKSISSAGNIKKNKGTYQQWNKEL